MELPIYVKKAIGILEQNGFEAYAVGGCVRDMLRGEVPHDYDITTSAMPEEIKKCFDGYRVIETGIKHGTVSVIADKNILEITTYRIDGEYTDNRHPGRVSFTSSLKEDLMRRDFTVNAMALGSKGNIIDCFGGRDDLENKIIRCVGDAKVRFEEDALRILRALRFAARFGFKIQKDTADALLKKRRLLLNISAERIRDELCGIIMTDSAGEIMERYARVFEVFIPELTRTKGLNQYNKAHIYDVFNHTLKAVEASEKDITIRLCMLLHDIGKPCCFTRDEHGTGHFYGHQKIGASMAKEILTRLRFDNQTIKTVTVLVNYHDGQISPDEKSVRRWLRRLGEENMRLLLEVKKADSLAHEQGYGKKRIAEIAEIEKCLDSVIEKNLCFSLKDLEFKGDDAMRAGFRAKGIGMCLDYLLTAVIENRCENTKEALFELASKYFAKCERKA